MRGWLCEVGHLHYIIKFLLLLNTDVLTTKRAIEIKADCRKTATECRYHNAKLSHLANVYSNALPKAELYRRVMGERPFQIESTTSDVPKISGCPSKTYSSGR